MQHRAVSLWAALALALAAAAPAEAFWPFPLGGDRVERKPLVRVRIPGDYSTAGEKISRQARAIAADLVSNLSRDCPGYGCLADGIVVTSFVELKNLSRTSSFGRYLGEELMGEMQRLGYRVVEIRKSREVMIAGRFGEYGLSRDPAAIRTRVSATAMLTGTYTLAGDSVVVNARIVDNRSGDLLASAVSIFPLDPVVESMLADAAAPGPEPSGVLYLKKLEM